MNINIFARPTIIKKLTAILLAHFFNISCFAESQQSTYRDADTGSHTWDIKAHGVYFSLTQILPDQSRAFYVNRGFTLEQIEAFATSCVYMHNSFYK
jgi:hypothetical protein